VSAAGQTRPTSNIDRSVVGYAIRPVKIEMICSVSNNILSGTSSTLAIEHMSAYMWGITDHTLGVGG
jgi:hypothetical protein